MRRPFERKAPSSMMPPMPPRAERIAAQFGFALERREGANGGLVILLGRDAARAIAVRPTA